MLVIAGWAVVGVASLIELTGCGDKPEYKDDVKAELLYEAAKFRRLTQYECVLLQRKAPMFQWLLTFSVLRNTVLLNLKPRGWRDAVRAEA